jgi:aspartyl aminopeptidase
VNEADGSLTEKLVNISRPILRVPTLAIHLDRSIKDGFSFNTELQLNPILASVDLDQQSPDWIEPDLAAPNETHHHALVKLLKSETQSTSTGPHLFMPN